MIDEKIYSKLPKINSLKNLYVIGYTIEVGSDEANKYIKQREDVIEGINEIYKDGKRMWNNNECSKFRIAIFKKNSNELVVAYRPDMANFSYKNGKEYSDNLMEDIEETYQEYAKNKQHYNWYKLDEKIIKRQINEKCKLNNKKLLYQDVYILEKMENLYIDILLKSDNGRLPECVNSRFGNLLIEENKIIGRIDDMISYINLQLSTSHELFFEDELCEKEKYINMWTDIKNKIKERNNPDIFMIQRKENSNFYVIVERKEVLKELVKIHIEQEKVINREAEENEEMSNE